MRTPISPPPPSSVLSSARAARSISASAAALHGPGKEKPVQNIWCVGRNYAEHIKELSNDPGEAKYPMIFLKAGSTICPSGQPIALPSWSQVRGRERRRVEGAAAHDETGSELL